MNTSLLIESRRYCHTTISPPFSDDPKSQKNSQQQPKSPWRDSEITKLCKENKASEAFEFFQKHPTLFNAKDMLEYYAREDDQDSVTNALRVYDLLMQQQILPNHNIFFKLMALCDNHNQFDTILKLYHDMEKYHVPVNSHCFPKIAVAIFKQKDKMVAKKLLNVLKTGVDYTPYNIYISFILSLLDNFDDAMWIFDYMLKNNIQFNKNCFIEFLKACSSQGPSALEYGQKVHAELLKSEFKDNGVILNLLLQMYAKCGDVNKSIEVFETFEQPDQILWNLIINLCANHNHPRKSIELYDKMIEKNVTPTEITFTNVLTAISNLGPSVLEMGKIVHQQIKQLKFDTNMILLNSLIKMYNKCGEPSKSLEIYDQIERQKIPTKITLTNILSAISNIGPNALEKGKRIHQQITKQKFETNVILLNSLIQMYNLCGKPLQSIEIYDQMVANNITRDEFTFNKILLVISNIGPNALEKGKQIHQQIKQLKFDSNLKIITSLIQMYDKCGEPTKSLELFDYIINNKHNIPLDKVALCIILTAISNIGPNALEKGKQIHQHFIQHKFDTDFIIVTSLIQMYDKCGEPTKSVEIYDQMIENNITPDEVTFINLLTAISNIGPTAIKLGEQIHQQIAQRKFDTDMRLICSLIQMYNKCGEPNTSIEVYDKMISNNITPDEITFTNILTTISNIGPNALEKGKQIHQQITQYKFDSNVNLITSLIQMYDKCGEPTKSLELHTDLASRVDIIHDEVTLLTVLNACAHLGEVMTTFKQKFKVFNRLRNLYYRNNEDETRKQVVEKFQEFKESPQFLHVKESHTKAIEKGKQIHQQIVQYQNLSHNQLLTTALMKMYTFCHEYDESEKLFEQLHTKNDISFHFILITYSYIGTNALEKGKQIHQLITQQSSQLRHYNNIIVFNSLIQMYNNCGDPNKALEFFEQLVAENITPNEYTYTHVLSAISTIGNSALEKGKELHQRMATEGFDKNTFALNALIKMYDKCGEPNKSLEIYDQMVSNNITLNEYTYRYALEACLTIGTTAFEKGKKIHQDLLDHHVFE